MVFQRVRRLRVGLVLLAGVASAGLAQPSSEGSAVASLSAEEMARIQKAGAEVLFWSNDQRAANFRAMETLFPGTVAKAGTPRPLPAGEPLAIDEAEIKAFMAEQNVAGLMVIQDGKLRYQGYGMGFGPDQRWTSFSVAKSVTSTLLGAAVKDGYIKSLDDPVTDYVPEIGGSGYDGVTIRQILTMTSGVKWNEDYTDPASDVVRMLSAPVKPGEDPNVAYLAKLPREAEPGSKWVYKTGETNLIGVIVARATGKQLTDYAKDKLVDPAGFEGDLFWMVDPIGQNVGGCCLSLRLADYARIGLFALEGGNGQVPEGWFGEAGDAQVSIGFPGFGYGYQWWTYPGNTFGAQGIFGQAITVIPEKKLVIAAVSNWPKASGAELRMAQLQFFQKLADAAN